MTLLAVSAKLKGFPDVTNAAKVQPIEAIELSLRSAEILFDQAHNPILAISWLGAKAVATVPGPKDVGYFRATDEEVQMLRKAGYALPDWRELRIEELVSQYPTWSAAP